MFENVFWKMALTFSWHQCDNSNVFTAKWVPSVPWHVTLRVFIMFAHSYGYFGLLMCGLRLEVSRYVVEIHISGNSRFKFI